ncbi:hypothetical protein K502DRAFT_345830 [Neoconidiobolus thromboides FSU 785]|nr:hypothetical protein K502DRAFT_345830 [Neoconidiobolus thromboides FSU 785]
MYYAKVLYFDISIKDTCLIGVYKLIGKNKINDVNLYPFISNQFYQRFIVNTSTNIEKNQKELVIGKMIAETSLYINKRFNETRDERFKVFSKMELNNPLLYFKRDNSTLIREKTKPIINSTTNNKVKNPLFRIISLINNNKCFPRITKEFRRTKLDKLDTYQYEMEELIILVDWMEKIEHLYIDYKKSFFWFYEHVLCVIQFVVKNKQDSIPFSQVETLLKIFRKLLRFHNKDVKLQKLYIKTVSYLLLDGHKFHVSESLVLALEKSNSFSFTVNILGLLTKIWLSEKSFNMLKYPIIRQKLIDAPWKNFTLDLELKEKYMLTNKIKEVLDKDNFKGFIELGKFWGFNGCIGEALNLLTVLKLSDEVMFRQEIKNYDKELFNLINIFEKQTITTHHVDLLLIFQPKNEYIALFIKLMNQKMTEKKIDNDLYILNLNVIRLYLLSLNRDKGLFDYELLVDIYCQLGQMNKVEEILSIIERNSYILKPMVVTKILTKKFKSSNILKYEELFQRFISLTNMNIVHLTLLLMKYGDHKDLFHKVLDIIKFIEEPNNEISPDIVTFQVLLNIFISQYRKDLLNSYLKGLEKYEMNPDLKVYTTLINYFGRYKTAEKIIPLLKQIHDKNMIIDLPYLKVSIRALNSIQLPLNFTEEIFSTSLIEIYRNNPSSGYEMIKLLILELTSNPEAIKAFTIRFLDIWASSPSPSSYPHFIEIIHLLIRELFKLKEDRLLTLIWYYLKYNPIRSTLIKRSNRVNLASKSREVIINSQPNILFKDDADGALMWALDRIKLETRK